MAGPSAVLHPPRRPHADQVADEGLETLTVEFDLAWLRSHGFDQRMDRSQLWNGGGVARAARALARVVTRSCSEAAIGNATTAFLHTAVRTEDQPAPPWLASINQAMTHNPAVSTRQLACMVDLNTDYLARAYRFAAGEGIYESVRRRRVEQAAAMLRRSDRSLVDIALASGFCDQSHMNRCFRAVLGRTPLAVRDEGRLALAQA